MLGDVVSIGQKGTGLACGKDRQMFSISLDGMFRTPVTVISELGHEFLGSDFKPNAIETDSSFTSAIQKLRGKL